MYRGEKFKVGERTVRVVAEKAAGQTDSTGSEA